MVIGRVEEANENQSLAPMDMKQYLDFQICEGAAFFAGVSSAVVTTDFEISSAPDAGKFKISDDRNGSVAALDTLALSDRYPPLPKSTWR